MSHCVLGKKKAKKNYRDTEGRVVAEELLDLGVDVTLRAQRSYPLYHYLQCEALSIFFIFFVGVTLRAQRSHPLYPPTDGKGLTISWQ